MIRRPSDVWPEPLLSEFRALAALPEPVVRFVDQGDGGYHCVPHQRLRESRLFGGVLTEGVDYAGLLASVAWLKEGPKVVDVTEEQFEALSRVEVRLEIKDFHMPYPVLLVNMPPGKMHQYVLLYKDTTLPVPMLVACSVSYDNKHDIVFIMRHYDGKEVEEMLHQFHDPEVTGDEKESTTVSQRVACNMALAMTNFGCQAQYLFPAEAARERKYVAKGDRVGRGGRTASQRLAEQPMVVTLNRDVVLYHRESSGHGTTDPTGREMPFHWRRGHWRKARVGTGRTETRLVFIRPCMIRADLLTVDKGETTTSYHRE